MLNEYQIMRLYAGFLVVCLAATTISSAIPKPGEDEEEDEDEHKNRQFDRDLSDQEHYDPYSMLHNPEYDHESFLGKEEARRFDALTPEESKKRLGKMFKKIDLNRDKKVSEDELKQWIKKVSDRYVNEDADRQWKEQEIDEEGYLTWDAYRKRTYGFTDDEQDGNFDDYGDMIRRDRRRWDLADTDKDNRLTKLQYTHFLHPEDEDHMREVVIDETLDDIDKDGDRMVSLKEYIDDTYPNKKHVYQEWVDEEIEVFKKQWDVVGDDGILNRWEMLNWLFPQTTGRTKTEAKHLMDEADANKDMWPPQEEDEEEPDWVKTEREQFVQFRDKNKDGFMDRSEVEDWILPPDYDHTEAEARHLVYESDTDKDGFLTEEEVLDKYDLFVGSQATDFGEELTRHDEF